jgi:hypothetical protein
MTKFKFFRGYVGTLDLIDGETYATASIFDPATYWTSEEIEIERIRRMQLANEFDGRIRMSQEQYNLNRDMFAQHEIVRRQRIDTDNQIRLYQATRVTTVNPKWWMKIKIVLQETWLSDPVGMVVMTLLVSVVTFIGILKLFGA